MTAATPGIAGRVFSVTGGASGMGAATVQLLAAQGASTIWIADWNTEKFDKVIADVAAINPLTKVHTNKVDVSDAKQVNDWVSTIIADSRILHGAANVAGLSQPAFTKKRPALLAQDDESWDIILGVNLHGIMYCTRAQVRAMIEIPAGNNPAIVNVSSLASLLRGPTAFAYGVSKAACAHFTACVAKDLYSFGIRANTVSPGTSDIHLVICFYESLY